ncbi:hypothetical protein AAC387_Pa03g0699 [Persea americana]
MTREPKGIGTRVNSWVVFLGLPTPKSWYIQLRRSYGSLPQGDEEMLLQLLLSPLRDTVPKEILLNPRFEPYFKDCIGAIDGTLVHAIIQPEKQIPYRAKVSTCPTW